MLETHHIDDVFPGWDAILPHLLGNIAEDIMHLPDDDFGLFTRQNLVEQLSDLALASDSERMGPSLTRIHPSIEHSILAFSYPAP